jgi:hypothetical protein
MSADSLTQQHAAPVGGPSLHSAAVGRSLSLSSPVRRPGEAETTTLHRDHETTQATSPVRSGTAGEGERQMENGGGKRDVPDDANERKESFPPCPPVGSFFLFPCLRLGPAFCSHVFSGVWSPLSYQKGWNLPCFIWYIDAKFQGTVQLFRLLGCFTQAWFKGIRVSEHCLVLRRLPWNAVGGGGEGGCLRWVPQPADLRHRPQGPWSR